MKKELSCGAALFFVDVEGGAINRWNQYNPIVD